MSDPLIQITKPRIDSFADKRKLFLVPIYIAPKENAEEGQQILTEYWIEVSNQITSFEQKLGKIINIFHEGISSEDQKELDMLKQINEKGSIFIQSLLKNTAKIIPTEKKELIEETIDWQRCLSVGLVSSKAYSEIMSKFQAAITERYSFISEQIDKNLQIDTPGILFINEEHKVQFSDDIQVFYVSPPSVDKFKKWREKYIIEMREKISTENINEINKEKETTPES